MVEFHEQFQILELPVTATREQVKTAFRELSHIWHPDRFTHNATLLARAEEHTKAINAAYHVLSSNWDAVAQWQKNSLNSAGPSKSTKHSLSPAVVKAPSHALARGLPAALLVVAALALVGIAIALPNPKRATLKSFTPQASAASTHLYTSTEIIELDTKSSSVLLQAASRCDLAAMEVALKDGEPVDQTDSYGVSALARAARVGCKEGVALLLRRGANIELPATNGFTPITWARTHNQQEMVDLLLAAGAKPPAQFWNQ